MRFGPSLCLSSFLEALRWQGMPVITTISLRQNLLASFTFQSISTKAYVRFHVLRAAFRTSKRIQLREAECNITSISWLRLTAAKSFETARHHSRNATEHPFCYLP